MANNTQFTGMQPRPPTMGHVGPLPTPIPPMSMQFRPGILPPPPPPQPLPPQQFQPVGHSNVVVPPHPSQVQYPQAAQTLPPPPPQHQRSGHMGHGLPQGQPLPPPPPPPDFQPNRAMMSAPAPPQISNNFMASFSGPRIPPASYINQAMPPANVPNFSAGTQPWFNQNPQLIPPQPPAEQSAGGQPWFPSGNQSVRPVTAFVQNGQPVAQQWVPSENQNVQSGTPSGKIDEQSASLVHPDPATQTEVVKKPYSDWKEYSSDRGKKFYYNKRTKISSWEKPSELMTPTERADATTDWKEFSSPDGIKFYHNKVTKRSTWRIPEEVKLARERMHIRTQHSETPAIMNENSATSAAASVSEIQGSTLSSNNLPFSVQVTGSSQISATPVINPETAATSGSSSMQEDVASVKENASGQPSPVEIASSTVLLGPPVPSVKDGDTATPTKTSNDTPSHEAGSSGNGASNVEEANISATVSESGGPDAPEIKNAEHGPLAYETKEEAKQAFRSLLEMADVGSSWTWDQAMRAIINDRRYGALKSLGERKQAFNEFVSQKKKKEADEKRARQKKAREDFKIMLEESKDLTSSTRWSKAIGMFENDERFQAMERAKDREDIFIDHLEELKKKERAKALEESRRHKAEYLEFLKSCDFIKASSQWRKVQHRLEADERCLRLDKIERLEIFQEYLRDLEKEEEEQRKLRMEEQRRVERKNRDEFRKLMEEHVASGIITAKTVWRDYCMKVKEAPAYLAVSSNAAGSTAYELFEDVREDIEKQYFEDKERIGDAIKSVKISLSSSWTVEDLKAAISKEIKSKPISDINLKLVHDELMAITKDKEEKEAKRRKRIAEDLYEFLYSSKDITPSSKWEDCKPLVDGRFVGEESFFREIFDKFITELKEKEKEKERKRKEEKARREKDRKEKERKDRGRKEKEKEKDRKSRDRGDDSRKSRERRRKDGIDSGDDSRRSRDKRKKDDMDSDRSESHSWEENKWSRDRDRDRKPWKRWMEDDLSLDGDENDRSKSHRHSSDKKSKQTERQSSTGGEGDAENQRKRHKKDNSESSNKNHDGEEHQDGEVGEDGEILF